MQEMQIATVAQEHIVSQNLYKLLPEMFLGA